MILRGILDYSLSGQLCMRGFARIKDLAKISKADYSYQRNLIDGREDIVDFLENQNHLFFPEIILGYKIKYSFNSKNRNTPLENIQINKGYKSDIDNTLIKIKSVSLTGENNSVKIIELTIDENQKNFHRIDGNHRLKAAEQSMGSKVDTMTAPFCIILGQDLYDNGISSNSDDAKNFDKAIKIYFHNINTKTIPLTSEQNLKVIIDDTINFTETDLIDIFDGEYPIKTRELIRKIKPELFTGIKHILSKQYRTYYNEVFYKLIEKGEKPENVVDKVFESLKAIDQLYKNTANLKSNSCFGLLTAFLYYHIEENEVKFEMFKNWILNNHIFEIEEVKVDSIIKIFDKIAEQEIKIFVAMPYYEGNSKIVEEYNKIYNDVISNIKKEYGYKISLYPIMNNKGETQDQIQDIINKIKACTIFIADISNNNANVLYETGWARALNKYVLIVREKNSEKPKSDYANDTYHEYDKTHLNISLTKIAKENILQILVNNFGLVK